MSQLLVQFAVLNIFFSILFATSSNGDLFPNAVKSKTDQMIGYPNAISFLNNYEKKPLLMRKAALSDMSVSSLPDAAIMELPHSFIIFVKPINSNRKISLRQFLKTYSEEQLTIKQQIPVVLKSQIKLPSCLDCDVLTEDRLSYTEILIRQGAHVNEFESRGSQNSSLNCLLDGTAELTLVDAVNISKNEILSEEISKSITNFHQVSLKPGDCLHIPSNWLYRLSSGGRTIFFSVVYNSSNLTINKKTCGDGRPDMTLDGLTFLNETPENLFSVLTLANLALFIENYVQKTNMTRNKFMETFKKDVKLSDVKQWNEECETSTNELFDEMDHDKNNILSAADFDSINEEDAMFLGGVLEDKMGDFKDIIEDQLSEMKPKRSGTEGLANQVKSTYEKEIQRVLEEGFNDLLRESNIDGSLTFSDDGKPQVKLNGEEKGTTEIEEELEEIIVDNIDDVDKIKSKDEL